MTERQFKLRFPWLICQSKPEYPNSYQNIPSNICSFHSKNNIQTTTSTSSLSFLHFLPQRQQKNVVLDMIISLLSIYLQISKIITLSQMEDFPFKAQRHYTEIPTRDLYQQKKGFFRNYLRSQAKRFSSLVISNAITIEDNRIYFKIFMLSLEKPPSQRTQEDDLATCKVLIQENIFPEFHNDLNIVKMFAKQLMIKQVPAGHAFLTKSSKDDNLYKIIKGEVSFKKGKNGECMLKGKGEFIEKFQQFKSVKDFDVHCREETYFLVINFKSYEQGMKIYLQNKIILKMLMKIQIFQTLQRKEIACLLTKCQERVLTCKEQFFREGDFDNDMLYFLVQGEIVISKVDDKRKRQIVCYLGDGSLFGEQTIFLQKKRREYSAAVHSSQARVIQISRANINEMLTSFEHNKQQFYNNIQYKEYLQHKNQHYQQKLREAAQVKNIYSSFVQIKKPNNAKQLQMSSILREAENYAITLENKERILQKKNIFFKERKLISVDAPLFGRDDFPGYKHSMKRYEIYQAKAKENSCKLPQIN